MISLARPDSPNSKSLFLVFSVPAIPPRTRQTTMNAIHIPIARHGWVALHRATRTVAGCLVIVRSPRDSPRVCADGYESVDADDGTQCSRPPAAVGLAPPRD